MNHPSYFPLQSPPSKKKKFHLCGTTYWLFRGGCRPPSLLTDKWRTKTSEAPSSKVKLSKILSSYIFSEGKDISKMISLLSSFGCVVTFGALRKQTFATVMFGWPLQASQWGSCCLGHYEPFFMGHNEPYFSDLFFGRFEKFNMKDGSWVIILVVSAHT